jgi:hypothetical protein
LKTNFCQRKVEKSTKNEYNYIIVMRIITYSTVKKKRKEKEVKHNITGEIEFLCVKINFCTA